MIQFLNNFGRNVAFSHAVNRLDLSTDLVLLCCLLYELLVASEMAVSGIFCTADWSADSQFGRWFAHV